MLLELKLAFLQNGAKILPVIIWLDMYNAFVRVLLSIVIFVNVGFVILR